MAENERRTINPNIADVETLSALPGIGREMAKRIIDARPYRHAEDLRKVQGIGPTVLARLQSELTFNGSEDDEGGSTEEAEVVEAKVPEAEDTHEMPPPPEQAAQEPVESREAEGEVAEAPPGAPETPPEPVTQPSEEPEAAEPPVGAQTALGEEVEEAEESEGAESTEAMPVEAAEEAELAETTPGRAVEEPQPVRRGWVLWVVAGSALLILILSLGLNLGILASINNGGLQFASPAELGEVRVRVDGLNARADELGQEVQGLRARLDNVEAFGGRIDALEGSTEQLGAELEDTASEVQGLSTEVSSIGQELDSLGQDLAALDQEIAGVQDEVQTLQEQTARTESFFEGLQSLLDELFTAPGGEQ